MSTPAEVELVAEARRLARYLGQRTLSDDLAARYAAAHAHLPLQPTSPADARIATFALRHRWLLGPLDAAAALLRPACTLRCKLSVLSAIIETTPAGAREYLPPARVGTYRLARTLLGAALATAWRLALGLPAWWWLARGGFANMTNTHAALAKPSAPEAPPA